MKYEFRRHLFQSNQPVKKALEKLDELAADAVLFVTNKDNKLMGSLTDGDIRRGLIKGYEITQPVDLFINKNPHYIEKDAFSLETIIALRKGDFEIIPVTENGKVVNVINFRLLHSYLPIDAVIMAGGRGKRLKPLTDEIPKPLLKIGDKPIIEHNIDRLIKYGIEGIWLTVGYLGEQLEEYFGDGSEKRINIRYIWEQDPLGTAGALSKISEFYHDHILLMNSDLLTNINYEEFYRHFLDEDADLAIAAVPYSVEIPYAVLNTSDNKVLSFREKPTYTYHSNAGIYLLRKEALNLIPKNEYFDITDLIDKLLSEKRRVITYPFSNYWLDIGKPEDFKKAQEDIKHLKL